jgi:nitrate reductase gamma subunit
MRFEELQAVWETQTDQPLFSINPFGLHMALYQQRERARRRLFWGVNFPYYVGSLFMLGTLVVIFASFYSNDLPMESGDWVAFLVAAGSLLFAASSMYVSRRKHEQEQNMLAPSLRQEIDRGLAQLEFEVGTHTGRERWRNSVFVGLGMMLLCWEVGRLKGNPAPWDMALFVLAVIIATGVVTHFVGRRYQAGRLPRKRALEALRAKLDEGGAPSQT